MKVPAHHVATVEPKKGQMLNNSSSNYTSLLPTTNGSLNGINISNSHPNISHSNTVGLPSQPPPFASGNTSSNNNNTQLTSFSSNNNNALRNPKIAQSSDPFVNPYMRTSNNHINGMAGMNAHHQYSNVGIETNSHDSARLSAGVYSASHQNNRSYKTNSLGGGSSSSGVVSTGGSSSSPGHSPVGSVSASNQTGTHV